MAAFGVLEGVFNQIDRKSIASTQKEIDRRKGIIDEMTNDEVASSRNRFGVLKKIEKDGMEDTLKAFHASSDKANSITQQSFKRAFDPKVANVAKKLGIQDTDMQDRINKGLAERTTLLGKVRYLSKVYYDEDEKGRKAIIDGLKQELDGRKAMYAEQQRINTQAKMMVDAGKGGNTAFMQGDKAISWEDVLKTSGLAMKHWKNEVADGAEILKHFTTTLDKSEEATAQFTRDLKNEKEVLGQLENKLSDVIGRNKKLAHTIAVNVSNAFQGFRDILQQSVITLTLVYYKLNQVIGGFQEFEKELINAQSIFQTTNETLYSLSNQIVEFGTEFGISYDNAARGLYQFASAGLSAEDSMKVLNDTLKLSMAVQGDHNTISKLTTQVIFGFGMQMDEATAVTDKFAHAINKSLIEYQDLASAVKFSMPFFVSSGQSLDTLLGALQVLTNRALEAGIAGRGLRQALAEFTQHADDNSAAFRQLGVEILDNEGNMKSLTDIAHQFNDALGESATDMEVMMTLMQDLNIRGATAFIHLAQNADEFESAVNDLQNSAGSATKMAEIQQQSLFNQIQILKNALMAPFLLADPAAVARGEMNRFGESVKGVTQTLKDQLVITSENGVMLTEVGFKLRNVAIRAVERFGVLLERVVKIMDEWSEAGLLNIDVLKLYFLPISIVVGFVDTLGGGLGKLILTWYVLNKTIALNAILFSAWGATVGLSFATFEVGSEKAIVNGVLLDMVGQKLNLTYGQLAIAISGLALGFVVGYIGAKKLADVLGTFGPLITVVTSLAIAVALLMAASTAGASASKTLQAWLMLTAAGIAIGGTIGAVASYATSGEDEFDTQYEAYASQMDAQRSQLTAQTFGGSTQTLNVQNLNYTDSNEAVYMRKQSDTQIGAFQ